MFYVPGNKLQTLLSPLQAAGTAVHGSRALDRSDPRNMTCQVALVCPIWVSNTWCPHQFPTMLGLFLATNLLILGQCFMPPPIEILTADSTLQTISTPPLRVQTQLQHRIPCWINALWMPGLPCAQEVSDHERIYDPQDFPLIICM